MADTEGGFFVGDVVVVTGATSGIGYGAATAFHDAGMRVAALGRSQNTLQQMEEQYPEMLVLFCDVTDSASVSAAFARIFEVHGHIDYAFNSAGISGSGQISTLTLEQLQSTFDVNVAGLLVSMQHERALMRNGGSIANVTSVHARHLVFPGIAAYASSKAAASMLTRSAAVEWAPEAIRVNSIAPGPIASPMLDESERVMGAATRWKELTPNGRVGTVDDVTNAAFYLFSHWSKHVTGHELAVDGGYAAV